MINLGREPGHPAISVPEPVVCISRCLPCLAVGLMHDDHFTQLRGSVADHHCCSYILVDARQHLGCFAAACLQWHKYNDGECNTNSPRGASREQAGKSIVRCCESSAAVQSYRVDMTEESTVTGACSTGCTGDFYNTGKAPIILGPCIHASVRTRQDDLRTTTWSC